MTEQLRGQAFTGGELSEAFFGRTDLDKYDTAVAEALNFFVDYRGGISTRPGTEFCAFLEGTTRLFAFSTEFQSTPNFIVIFGDSYVRFAQQGEYLTEAATTVTAASGAVITAAGHGATSGTWVAVAVGGKNFIAEITDVSGDDLTLVLPNGVVPSLSGTGTVAKLLTLASPYTATQVGQLRFTQRLNEVTLTHPDHAPRKLRFDGTTWTLTTITFGSPIAPPTGINIEVVMKVAATDSHVGVIVTSVDQQGNESIGSPLLIKDSIGNYTTEQGSMRVTWLPVAGAASYNVYRTSVASETSLSKAQEVGFIGSTRAPIFVDANIIPDFTRTPPLNFNPFANGAVTELGMLTLGSGYAFNTTVSIADGTGFAGVPVVGPSDVTAYAAGALTGVLIQQGGSGYTLSSAVTFDAVGGGTGATAEVRGVTPASGNYPTCAGVFQQRQVYAGSRNEPITVWASKPGQFENFDFSDPPNSGDAYTFQLDVTDVSPIKHLLSIRDGLLVFHSTGVDRLLADEGRAVTALSAVVEPQADLGVSDTEPVKINNDILYAQQRGAAVQALFYTFYTNSYTAQDISILSNHLLGKGLEPRRFVWNEEPHKIVWVPRADGALLSLTYLREQEVFGWCKHQTQGFFRDAVLAKEPAHDVLYVATERFFNNRHVQCLERLQAIATDDLHWNVDCGVRYEGTRPQAALQITEASGVYTLTALSAVFGGAAAGDVIRALDGIFEITSVVSSTVVEAGAVRAPTRKVPFTDHFYMARSGEWLLSSPITSLGGLDYLEGQTVSILADGDVEVPKVVTDGSVTFEYPRTHVTLGLRYTGRVTTLPLSDPENQLDGKKKRLVGTAIRVRQTRGLFVGAAGRRLYPVKEAVPQIWDAPREFLSETFVAKVSAHWEKDAQLTVQQDDPLPATVLGLVYEVQV